MRKEEDILEILRWNRNNAILVTAGLLITLIFNNVLFLASFSFVSFLFFFRSNWSLLKSMQPFGGYGNWVTFFRFILLVGVMLSWNLIPNSIFVAILICFVGLDGVDGWAARKNKQTTVFGQYFDMELDALFVLFCCVILYFKGISGLWILLPGALRYLFVLFTWILGPKEIKEERTSYGASIAVLFFISLLISLTFQNTFQSTILIISGLSIVVSFGISFYKYILA